MSSLPLRNNSVPAWSVDVDSKLTAQDLEFFQRQILLRCGVLLQKSKSALIESRLRKRLLDLGLRNFTEYRDYLSVGKSDVDEWQTIINCLTTHTTDWFREVEHFNELRNQFIPNWLGRKMSRPLRVWSVACSSGEEPYSIALVLNYFHDHHGLNYEITATDIDTNVVKTAKRGVYPSDDLRRIPKEFQTNALALGVGNAEGVMRVRQHIKDRIQFIHLNLNEIPYDIGNTFDLIFCRNVLIYFPPDVVTRVANGLYDAANPGALLLTGHSESFSNLNVKWTFSKPTHYVKKGNSK